MRRKCDCLATGLLGLALLNLVSWAHAETAGPGASVKPQLTSSSSDWPQFRGANRDSIAQNCPKLLDKWPKEGPPLRWKSERIPGFVGGGAGSVTVADGRVYVFLTWEHWTPKVLITEKYISDYGWAADMPADLVKKVDDAISGPELVTAYRSKTVDAFAKKLLDGVAPELSTKFGTAVTNRLKAFPGGWSWETLKNMSAYAGREVNTPEELEKIVAGTNRHHNDALEYAHTQLRLSAIQFTDTIVCLDDTTGKELWKKEFPGTFAGMWGVTFGASGTPAISGDKCYATGSAGVYCLNAKTGELVWKVVSQFSNSSPLVADGILYALISLSDKPRSDMGGHLTALDAATGRLIWAQPKITSRYGTSPALWRHDNKNYLICNSDIGLSCVDLVKGDILWTTGGGNGCSPTVDDDVCYIHPGNVLAFKLTPTGAERLWEGKAGAERAGSPIFSPQGVFFGGVTGVGCLDPKTGAKTWAAPGGCHFSSATMADGKIFVPVDENNNQYVYSLRMYKAQSAKFEELGRFAADVTVCSSPTIAGGKLYLRQTGGVACYDLRDQGR